MSDGYNELTPEEAHVLIRKGTEMPDLLALGRLDDHLPRLGVGEAGQIDLVRAHALVAWHDLEPPRHPEVNDEAALAGVEQQVLGAPANIGDAPALEPGREVVGHGPAQAPFPDDEAFDAPALEPRPDAAQRGFDFR